MRSLILYITFLYPLPLHALLPTLSPSYLPNSILLQPQVIILAKSPVLCLLISRNTPSDAPNGLTLKVFVLPLSPYKHPPRTSLPAQIPHSTFTPLLVLISLARLSDLSRKLHLHRMRRPASSTPHRSPRLPSSLRAFSNPISSLRHSFTGID